MIIAAGQTDVGCKRSANEDRILVRADEHVFAVADGMGGERCGGHAAELAVLAVDEYFQAASESLSWNNLASNTNLQTTQLRMATAIRLANERIFRESISGTDCRGMGCTIAVVCVSGEVVT